MIRIALLALAVAVVWAVVRSRDPDTGKKIEP